MGATLDRSEAQDHLDLVEAAADLTLAALTAREAKVRLVRLARRVVVEPALSDEEVVRLAYPVANGFRLELARALQAEAEEAPCV